MGCPVERSVHPDKQAIDNSQELCRPVCRWTIRRTIQDHFASSEGSRLRHSFRSSLIFSRLSVAKFVGCRVRWLPSALVAETFWSPSPLVTESRMALDDKFMVACLVPYI